MCREEKVKGVQCALRVCVCGMHSILDSGTGGSEEQALFFRVICEEPRVYKDNLTYQPSKV